MPTTSDTYLDAAARIGDRIVTTADWSGAACGWNVIASNTIKRTRTEMSGNGYLYQGSAGISIFLADLWAATGDHSVLEHARGGLRFALQAHGKLGRPRLGLYAGDVGVAYAAVRLARLTGESEWIALAELQVRELSRILDDDVVFDVMAGSAGSILGLLAISAEVNGARDLAITMGEMLVRKAKRALYGWSWAGGQGNRQNLCGYAHGVSGIAHALLELFAHTGNMEWAFAASRSMAYERWHSRSGVWPDFRVVEISEMVAYGQIAQLRQELREGASGPSWRPTSMCAWCHGPAGIALTRRRAISLGIDVAAVESELNAASAAIRESLGDQRLNMSLCHGRFGNAEVLLSDRMDSDITILRRLAEESITATDARDGSWHVGVVGGFGDPSLLVGEAGVGHFLLRLADPLVPSVLWLADWAQTPAADQEALNNYREDEVLAAFPRSALVFNRASRPAARRFAGVFANVDASSGALRNAGDLSLSVADDAWRPVLADAVDFDLAVITADMAFDDYVEQFKLDLSRWSLEEIDPLKARFAVAPGGQLIRTRYGWRDYANSNQSLPLDRGETYALYRSGNAIKEQSVPEVVAACLTLFCDEPISLETAEARFRESVDDTAVPKEEVRKLVRSIVSQAVRGGYLRALI